MGLKGLVGLSAQPEPVILIVTLQKSFGHNVGAHIKLSVSVYVPRIVLNLVQLEHATFSVSTEFE